MAIEWASRGCKAKEGWWITQDDKVLRLSEMSPEHIKNCIDFIRTYGGKLRDYEHEKIDELEEELLKREKR